MLINQVRKNGQVVLEIIYRNSGSNNERNMRHFCQHRCFVAEKKLGRYWFTVLVVGKETGQKTRISWQSFWVGWHGQSWIQSKLYDLPVLDQALHLTERFCCSQGQRKNLISKMYICKKASQIKFKGKLTLLFLFKKNSYWRNLHNSTSFTSLRTLPNAILNSKLWIHISRPWDFYWMIDEFSSARFSAASDEEFAWQYKGCETYLIFSSRPREANFSPKFCCTREETAERTASQGSS